MHVTATDSHRARQALTDALRPARQRNFPRHLRAQFALSRPNLQLSAFSFAIYRPNSQISRQISNFVLQTVTSTGLLQKFQTKLANIQADLQFRATNCDIHRLTPKVSDQTRQYPGMSLTWCYSLEHPGRLQISQISFQRDLSPYSQQDAKQIPPNDVARFSGLSVLMYTTFA